jgi:hypothetical protein
VIFDLKSGKRRRVVQVVFGLLAVLFAVSFIGFGIGSDASGGIFDALGFGGGDSGSGNAQFDEQIEDAESTLEEDPTNARALLDLVNTHYSVATEGITTDQATGTISIEEDARSSLEDAVAAWQDYLDTDPRNPDPQAAASAAQAYRYLNDAAGAAEAQQIVADSSGTAADYAQLALYLYADGNLKEGDAAGEQAVEAADSTQREQIRKYTEQLAELARKQERQQERQQEQGGGEGAGAQLEDPFGGLGGGTALPPSSP